jgi:hypothetical protein
VAGSARICSPLGETRGGGEIGDEADAFLRFGRGPGLHQVLLPMGQKQRKTTVQKQQDLVLKKKKKATRPIHRCRGQSLFIAHCRDSYLLSTATCTTKFVRFLSDRGT